MKNKQTELYGTNSMIVPLEIILDREYVEKNYDNFNIYGYKIYKMINGDTEFEPVGGLFERLDDLRVYCYAAAIPNKSHVVGKMWEAPMTRGIEYAKK